MARRARQVCSRVPAAAVAGAVLALAGAAVYVPLRRLPFLADDYPNLLWPWNFIAPASPLFRPLHGALLWAGRAAFGLDAAAWHLGSLALHTGVLALAFALALRWAGWAGRPPLATAALTTALFAADPRAAQAVLWPSACGDLAYAAGFLGACLAWPRRPWLAAGLFLLALLAKEQAIVLPAALAVGEALRLRGGGRPPAWRALAPSLGVAAAFGGFEAVRPAVLRALGDRQPFLPPVTGGYGLVPPGMLLRHVVQYPGLTLFPWVTQAWALGPWWHDLVLAVPAAALAWRWLRLGGLRRAGVLWVLATVLPPVAFAPFDVSDLYLYLPFFGAALAAAEEAVAAVRRGPAAAALLAVAAFAALEVTALGRIRQAWARDGEAFARARAAILARARAEPETGLVLRGLPGADGEVYLWMDTMPYLLQLLAPGFRGGVWLDAPPPPGAGPVVTLTFGPDGRLLAVGRG
jgi:hypothetical protein